MKLLIIILITLSISTVIGIWTLLNKENKWLGVFIAFCTNTVILSIATWTLYYTNEEARLFGFGHTNLYLLIFSIPILTWINFVIIDWIKRKKLVTNE